jgi:hypothetical protein
MQPIENTLVAYLTPDRLRHSAFGTKFILTFGVGSVAVYVVGWIKTAWSLSAVFVAMSVVSRPDCSGYSAAHSTDTGTSLRQLKMTTDIRDKRQLSQKRTF